MPEKRSDVRSDNEAWMPNRGKRVDAPLLSGAIYDDLHGGNDLSRRHLHLFSSRGITGIFWNTDVVAIVALFGPGQD